MQIEKAYQIGLKSNTRAQLEEMRRITKKLCSEGFRDIFMACCLYERLHKNPGRSSISQTAYIVHALAHQDKVRLRWGSENLLFCHPQVLEAANNYLDPQSITLA